MKIDRVKYTAHYDEYGQLKDQWIGLEAAIDDTEDAKRQLTAIKELTESWYKSNTTPMPAPPSVDAMHQVYGPPRVIQQESKDLEPGLTPELLMSCTDIVSLQAFYKLVFELSNRVDLMVAYNKRKEELVAEEAKEILEKTEEHVRNRKHA